MIRFNQTFQRSCSTMLCYYFSYFKTLYFLRYSTLKILFYTTKINGRTAEPVRQFSNTYYFRLRNLVHFLSLTFFQRFNKSRHVSSIIWKQDFGMCGQCCQIGQLTPLFHYFLPGSGSVARLGDFDPF